NEAEYLAMKMALEWVKSNTNRYQITQMDFYADSQLLIYQLQGLYKVKASNLKSLWADCRQLLQDLNLPYSFNLIRREENSLADKLANQSMDSAYESKTT
ncbi:MAG TPA: reverse transcriptase-like protein, partial [Candidatus Woesebacteria bacterium]|nr:reverse transcriptase-like protein [Candidatus Woesebacteria bacterium]